LVDPAIYRTSPAPRTVAAPFWRQKSFRHRQNLFHCRVRTQPLQEKNASRRAFGADVAPAAALASPRRAPAAAPLRLARPTVHRASHARRARTPAAPARVSQRAAARRRRSDRRRGGSLFSCVRSTGQ